MQSMDILKREFAHFERCDHEEQNEEYEGAVFTISEPNIRIRSRLGKKTPKKTGYFVAFWEKDETQKNRPFQAKNSPEKLVIVIRDFNKKGLFIIPKDAAVERQILSTKDQVGKMAMRFYPPWCSGLNRTAQSTQKWQLNYFKDYSDTDL
ncbi:MepB family protein [Enterococcus sp. AZ192]|uniref:MepB family protein n=1 Tax=unclassified Enterococcus TaxID=2608891 RepID=UPI003D283282